MFPPRPDFLVISPPKTGTTWLADNFRRHPELFVPPVKEVKYFSSLHRVLDLDWYLAHFEPAGPRKAGDVSPSYAALPASMIRRVRDYFPNLKLVFLMRDPVGRAWSHARHAHHYREATFSDTPAGPATDERWARVFADDWSLLSGDYIGHLRRWSAIFPPEQLLVGFYEDIIHQPEELLRRVFRFLGVDPGIDLSSFPVRERILPGGEGVLSPELAGVLRGLLGPRTAELVAFLRNQFGLRPPAEWQATLQSGGAAPTPVPEVFAREGDDAFVSTVSAREEQFPTAYREVHREYRGYDLVYYRGRLLAVDRAACEQPIPGADHATIQDYIAARKCLAADSLPALKELVLDRVLEDERERAEGRFRALEARLEEARAVANRATADLTRVIIRLQQGTLAERAVRRVQRFGRRVVTHMMAGLLSG